jgi:hypothetical protein
MKTCYKVTYNPERLAYHLGTTVKKMIKHFQDGRNFGTTAELAVEKLYGIPKVENNAHVGYDNFLFFRVGVRTLTKHGISFQLSKFKGSGRECEHEDVIASLQMEDVVVVADITEFPIVDFIPFNAKILLALTTCDPPTITKSEKGRNPFYKQIVPKQYPNGIEWVEVHIEDEIEPLSLNEIFSIEAYGEEVLG